MGVLSNQTFLLHNGSVNKETVPTLLSFPGSWIENLLGKMQSAAYILNLIINKIIFSTNNLKTSFIPMVEWLRGGTFQAFRTKKDAATAIKFLSILHTTNIIKWSRQYLTFRVPCTYSPVHI